MRVGPHDELSDLIKRGRENSLSLHEHTLKKGHVRAQGESSYLQAMPTAGMWSGVRLSLSQPQCLVCKWPSDCTTCKAPALGPVATDWQTAPLLPRLTVLWEGFGGHNPSCSPISYSQTQFSQQRT